MVGATLAVARWGCWGAVWPVRSPDPVRLPCPLTPCVFPACGRPDPFLAVSLAPCGSPGPCGRPLPIITTYSCSNPYPSNFSVRQFSVTSCTTFAGTPPGTSAWISSVTRTFAPYSAVRCLTTSSMIFPASPAIMRGLILTEPWKR